MEPDLTKVSPGRREVLEKIALYELSLIHISEPTRH